MDVSVNHYLPSVIMQLQYTPLRILIVDDDPISRAILEDHLAASGHEVHCADSAAAAMYMLDHSPTFHIVIADWIMPNISGLDLCRWVRGRNMPRSLHFVMLTVLSDKERIAEAFEAGVDDFLSKPFHEAELLARLRAWTRLVSLQEQLTARHQESTRLAAELIEVNRRLNDLATINEVTGLPNRRHAMRRLEELWSVTSRYGHALTAAVLDIDRFKLVNDTHGHAVGDLVLKHVASMLSQSVRTADIACHFSGDEFLALFPHQTVATVSIWADRFKKMLAEQPLVHNGIALNVTCSIGLAERTENIPDAAALLHSADLALYATKRAGRDGVQAA